METCCCSVWLLLTIPRELIAAHAWPAGIHVTKSPECQPDPVLWVSAAHSCSPLGKGWHAPISHLRDMKSFAKLCPIPLAWLDPLSPPISFLTDPINFGRGFAGVWAVWSWLVPSWAMLPSSAISLCPALRAAALAQEEKQSMCKERIRAMRWKQCLREGGTRTDMGTPQGSHLPLQPLSSRSASVGAQQREANHLNKPPNLI